MRNSNSGNNASSASAASSGFGLTQLVAFILAAFCSWSINHSFIWMLFHGALGWLYLLYLCGGCGGGFTAPEENFKRLLNGTDEAPKEAPEPTSKLQVPSEYMQEWLAIESYRKEMPVYVIAKNEPLSVYRGD